MDWQGSMASPYFKDFLVFVMIFVIITNWHTWNIYQSTKGLDSCYGNLWVFQAQAQHIMFSSLSSLTSIGAVPLKHVSGHFHLSQSYVYWDIFFNLFDLIWLSVTLLLGFRSNTALDRAQFFIWSLWPPLVSIALYSLLYAQINLKINLSERWNHGKGCWQPAAFIHLQLENI